METKRLFFGLEVKAPWPEQFPIGRMVPERCRHATLAFLGNVPWDPIRDHLDAIPLPSGSVGLMGIFDDCLFLPPQHPHVVAWHITFHDHDFISPYQEVLATWLREKGYRIDRRPFLPHVTIARSPFRVGEWKRAFKRLPIIATAIHLYESTGNLNYQPIWTHPLIAPFEEVPHTADMAFRIHGQNLQQLWLHAQAALMFECTALIDYEQPAESLSTLDDVIRLLNALIARADSKIGCPFKAVSMHGEIEKDAQNILNWEMIVDV